MDKVNSDEEAAAQKFAYIYFNPVWEKEKYAESIKMLISFQQWQQSQPDHTQSEIIAGYIHKIDSLRETNRKLGEQLLQKGNNDSDAVEFGFWVNTSYEAGDYQRKHRIEPDMGGKYVEKFKKQYEELYKLFKQSKL